ncbi:MULTISPECIES: hypothetical protein [Microbacterium]|uniref:hypothetical protein n=1 Tax=Microbacterium TaxID=33882 RepID=UPI00146E0BAA|nr:MULTISPECIES: hypothetical protein [Microbacterium]
MHQLLDAWGVYTATLVLGVSVGINAAYGERWPQTVANAGTVAVFVALAVPWSNSRPWIAPIFITVAILSTVLITAARLRDHPLLQGVGYWRRAAMWILHPRRLAEVDKACP